MNDAAFQQCISPACGATYAIDDAKVACIKCGSLLDIRYDWSKLPVPKNLNFFEHRWATKGTEHEGKLDFSGVWRFRELMPFYRKEEEIVTIGEGRTVLQQADLLGKQLKMKQGNLLLQYEGLNPSGSFKDNGMTAAFTHANMIGAKRVACASTGNTSASLALFAALAEMQGIVFIGSGKISFGKLSQALDYAALTIQIKGDFDDCLRRIRQIALDVPAMGIYLMNSVNPFRLEGQKSIMYRVLEARDWEPPDWVIVPGGNLGNCSAFGKAFMELKELGLIKKVPRLAVINASGANTLYSLYTKQNLKWQDGKFDASVPQKFYAYMDEQNIHAHTIASAIEISRPVNLPKALRALDVMGGGVVREVSDEEILEHRAMVARWGFGCEPASAASVAGLHKLLDEQVISPSDTVVCILTGHELKDPNATVKYHTGIDMKSVQDLAREDPKGRLSNRPVVVEDDLESIIKAMGGNAEMLSGTNVKAHKSNVPLTEFEKKLPVNGCQLPVKGRAACWQLATNNWQLSMTSIAITGANGRMGRRLIALARESAVFTIVAAIERPEHPMLQRDAGEIAGVGTIGVPITPDLVPAPQVLVDFTEPHSMRHWLKTCRDRGIAMVIGTTGLQQADHDIIDQAAAHIPILQAPNMSLGVNLMFKIVADVAKRLGDDYDIEIVEGHHRFKKDAPSGTAMGIAESILKATGKTPESLVFDRHGDDIARKRGEIGMHALRIGDEVGHHTAYFAALGERLEITHVATNRDTFVHGALRAAQWVTQQKPGRYRIADMLDLK